MHGKIVVEPRPRLTSRARPSDERPDRRARDGPAPRRRSASTARCSAGPCRRSPSPPSSATVGVTASAYVLAVPFDSAAFGGLTIPTVMAAGFLDGFNPCAFALLVLFATFTLTLVNAVTANGTPTTRGAPPPARRGLALRGRRVRHLLHHRPRAAELPRLDGPRPPRRPDRLDHRPGHGALDAQGRVPAGRGAVDDGPWRHPRADAEGDGARRARRDAHRGRPRGDLHRALLGRDVPLDHRGAPRVGRRRRRATPCSRSTTSRSSRRC